MTCKNIQVQIPQQTACGTAIRHEWICEDTGSITPVQHGQGFCQTAQRNSATIPSSHIQPTILFT